MQRLLEPLVTPDTLPVHPIRRLQVGSSVVADEILLEFVDETKKA